MNFNIVVVGFFILIIGGVAMNQAYGQVDSLIGIDFLQLGMIYSSENQFQISNDMNIREFSNGNIIRISGQTIEGFPYITYSKISDEKTDTRGVIFVDGVFIKLSFKEKIVQEEVQIEKKDDLSILAEYTQRVYSKQVAQIDVKIYEKQQNRLNDFNLNYGYISNTNIKVMVLDENNQEFYSSSGITDDKGGFTTEFLIPENSNRGTLTITISAENENSESSKVLQIFNLGALQNNPNSTP